MARSFNSAASDSITLIGGSLVTAPPLTISGWFYTTDLANTQVLCLLGRADFSQEVYLLFRGATVNDPVGARARNATTPAGDEAQVASAVTSGVWAHVAAVFENSTSRLVSVNGTVATNATAVTTTSMVDIHIGKYSSGGSFTNGRMAELAIHDVALTAQDIGTLAKGISPRRVRPNNLAHHVPFVRDVKDPVTALSYAVSGTAVADHPRIYA